jgi:hypothetical protein
VTAIADLTAIGCQVETTATAAEKVRWLGRDLVVWPDAIALIVRGWTTAAFCSGLGGGCRGGPVRVRRLRPGPRWREGRAESARLPERVNLV